MPLGRFVLPTLAQVREAEAALAAGEGPKSTGDGCGRKRAVDESESVAGPSQSPQPKKPKPQMKAKAKAKANVQQDPPSRRRQRQQPQDLVGRRVKVRFDDGDWYRGTVASYSGDGRHRVQYDDEQSGNMEHRIALGSCGATADGKWALQFV